ncbi:acyl-CoA thioesterase [Nakamurella lactea]|uniref:acyl-CoA thioesterase n=1 Tax=Nakamurella lactea TaxID=459515 RepID=UPI0006858B83|nr:acyl-CoA thioesterase domain-containing protein [Nakamurella lactea]
MSALTDILSVRRLGPGQFTAIPRTLGRGGRLYGGELASQALMAASATVPDDRTNHSLHVRFLRPGRLDEPLNIAVAPLHDGGSFSVRTVTVAQQGTLALHVSASFHVAEDGFRHTDPDEEPVPDLATAWPAADVAELAGGPTSDWILRLLKWFPLEFSFPRPPTRLDSRPETVLPPREQMWIRIPELPTNAARIGALVYASDLGLMGAAALPHGHTIPGRGIRGTSLEHIVWCHRPDLLVGWLLFDHLSPWADRGRALCRSTVRSPDGQAVATITQEALIRRS